MFAELSNRYEAEHIELSPWHAEAAADVAAAAARAADAAALEADAAAAALEAAEANDPREQERRSYEADLRHEYSKPEYHGEG